VKPLDEGGSDTAAPCIANPWLDSPTMPTKIGGKPAWLDFMGLPTVEDLACAGCGLRLVFLMQINTNGIFPGDHNHFRALFVFVCAKPTCWGAGRAGGFKVFRSHLPLENLYYPEEEPGEDEPPVWKQKPEVTRCTVCGYSASKRCSACKSTCYCSVIHQKFDWDNGHKELCTSQSQSDVTTNTNSKISWPHVLPEIEVELDEEYLPKASMKTDEQRMAEFEKLVAEMQLDTTPEEDDDADKPKKDKIAELFRKRTQYAPGQVLRYKQNGSPLWIGPRVPDEKDIPPCPHCGDERQYECQIMPQVLYYIQENLSPEIRKNFDLDFGVLAIYSCPGSCEVEDKHDVQEIVWHNKVNDAVDMR